MCGIIGNISRDRDSVAITYADGTSILKTIQHRGPDMQGQHQDGRTWLGHVRLSILDTSEAGRQPMQTKDGRYVITYNGEIYNYLDIASSLGLEEMRSHTDTEVLLEAFATSGTDAFDKFNGMFAFAIFDKEKEKLWLVRDRLGIKPLYYIIDENGLRFASEIKGIMSLSANVEHNCNKSALHEWLYYGNTLGENTLYAGIKRLLPGHYLEIDIASFTSKISCYWSFQKFTGKTINSGSVQNQIYKARELLERAVKSQLVSDVPVGIFLSGGIDSSAITAFASKHYEGELATYSAGFDFDEGVNELNKAKGIARRFGTRHHEIHISGVDLPDIVEKMVIQHDMPFSDAANIPLYLICSKLNDATRVILQGDGGDEMFGGYSRYTTLNYFKSARFIAKVFRVLNALTPRNSQHYRRLRYFNALAPSDIADVMSLLLTEEDGRQNQTSVFLDEFSQNFRNTDPFERYRNCQKYFKDEDIVNQMLFVDSMIILPDIFLEKVDRSTMASGVEVRVPFLDNELVDFCLGLTGPQKVKFGKKKWLLKKALEGLLPNDILYGKKTGFGVPYGFWLSGALRHLFFDHMLTFQNSFPGILNVSEIEKMYFSHQSRSRDRSFMLWKILNFMIWANLCPVALTSN